MYRHGHSTRARISPTYKSWYNMLRRCYDPTRPQYPRYGGRGIVVCARWQSFPNFLADMGERPDGTTLGRLNHDRMYCKANCEWQTYMRQTHTRSNTVIDESRRVEVIAAIRLLPKTRAKHGQIRDLAARFGVSDRVIGFYRIKYNRTEA